MLSLFWFFFLIIFLNHLETFQKPNYVLDNLTSPHLKVFLYVSHTSLCNQLILVKRPYNFSCFLLILVSRWYVEKSYLNLRNMCIIHIVSSDLRNLNYLAYNFPQCVLMLIILFCVNVFFCFSLFTELNKKNFVIDLVSLKNRELIVKKKSQPFVF